MGSDHVELVQSVLAALNRRDFHGALQRVSPEVEWQMSDRFSRTTRVLHGHDGVREAITLFDEALDDLRVVPVALHAAGDAVVAHVRVQGRVHGGGEPMAYELVHVWRIRDGLAAAVEIYATLEDAWAAVRQTPPSASSAAMSSPGTGRANR